MRPFANRLLEFLLPAVAASDAVQEAGTAQRMGFLIVSYHPFQLVQNEVGLLGQHGVAATRQNDGFGFG